MEKKPSSIFSFSIFALKVFAIVTIVGLTFNFLFENFIIYSLEVHGAAKINRIHSENDLYEIPIFGSSRAEGNYVPSIICDNCYNYGITGAQANIWIYMLSSELKKDRQTPIIINFDLNGFVYSDGDISNYLPQWNSTKNILKTSGKWNYSIPFIKYFGHFETYFKYFISEKTNFTQITEKGGTFKKNSLTSSKFNALVKRRLNSESYFSINKALILKFNNLIQSTKRKVVIVISPYHLSYFNKFRNIRTANKFLFNLKENQNIEIVDLRDYIKKDEHFTNTTHLNYEGAVKFSKKLNEVLSSSKTLQYNQFSLIDPSSEFNETKHL